MDRTVMVDGKKMVGKVVDFTISQDDWNEYLLADGTVLRVKYDLVEVLRLPLHNPMGDPVYKIGGNTKVWARNIPEHLRKEPELPTQVVDTDGLTE